MLWINGKMTDLTKKDAIHKLVDAKCFLERYSNPHDKWTEAINIGIEAIEIVMAQEEQEPTTKNDLGVDCISRQAVIDGIKEYFHDEYYQRTSIQDCRDCFIEDVLNHLPSVTPQEPRWIPVSERLPENKTYVLVTIGIPGRQPHARSGWYQDGFFHNDNGDCWRATDIEVKAWMPLPESYRAESEADNG
jgi:hypothetical protein